MIAGLPQAIRTYFDANAAFDVTGMLAPFARDAVVRDERRTHRGTDALRAWIEDATVAKRAVATPVAHRQDGDAVLVTADVAGAFAGSPVSLSFRFRLADGRIADLEIA